MLNSKKLVRFGTFGVVDCIDHPKSENCMDYRHHVGTVSLIMGAKFCGNQSTW